MTEPHFTADEQYLIHSAKAPSVLRASNTYMWTYLASSCILAGFAAYHGLVPMMLSAFIVLCGFRIYEESYTRKWEAVTRTVLMKYEAAVLDLPYQEPKPEN
jgi:hypothetical protein